MSQTLQEQMPKLHGLPITLPRDGAVQLEFEQGILIFRTSQAVAEQSKPYYKSSEPSH